MQKELGSNLETSYVLGNMAIVAALEIQSAVVAVNVSAMKALFSRVIDYWDTPMATQIISCPIIHGI